MFLISSNTFASESVNYAEKEKNGLTTLFENSDQQFPIEIKGRVIASDDGLGLPGVSVVVVGTSNGVSTDFDGNFVININSDDAVLSFSFMGYTTKTVKYEGANVLRVILDPDTQMLEEAVVVGFGTQKKISVTGSVTAIKPGELKTSSTQLTNSFAGRMAGVVSVQRSGEPGSNSSDFWIRGISTFGANNTPLVFLDGVEIHAGGDLNSLDPAIIENFTVLKDASSTALYGARGANGVILITTKNGVVSDKPIISARIESTVSTPTILPQFTDAVTYMNMANEAVHNSNPNASPKYSQQQIDGTQKGLDPYLFPNVDWMDKLFKQYSFKQYANVNIRGGSEKVRYFSSVSYTNDSGLIRAPEGNDNNLDFNRLNMQNNLSINVSKTTLLEVKINANFETKKGPRTSSNDLFNSVMYANPVMFPPTFPAEEGDDHIRFGAKPGGFFGVFPNPYAQLQSGDSEVKSNTVLALAKLSQEIPWIEGLSVDAMISVKSWSNSGAVHWYDPFYYRVDPSSIVQPAPDEYEYDVALIGEGGNTSLQYSSFDDGNTSIFFQPQINYNRVFGDNDIQALLVYNQKDFRVNDPGDFLSSLPYRNQGVSARFSYMYANKYMIETNMGYTGSENFAEENRFGFFPSISVGYAISNEKYFKDIFGDSVSMLKVRASYGLTGNDQIGYGRFPYLSDVNLQEGGLGYFFGQDFKNYRDGVYIRSYGNEDVTWETGEKANIGLDLSLKSGLVIAVDVFKEYRTGILMQRRVIPSFIGIGEANPYANIGEVENKGIDLSVNYNKAITSDLIIQAMGTFTFSKNKVMAIDEAPGYADEYPNRTEVGRPVGQIYGLRAGNIFNSQGEVDVNPEQTFGNYTVGDLRYLNVNDDGVVDENDFVPMGYPVVPEITYGFGASLRYKKLDFSFFFQGVAHTSFMMGDFHPFTTEFERNVQSFIADDYWSESNPNPNAGYPRLTEEYSFNNNIASSWWLRDGSFLRLKDLEFGYQVSEFLRVYAMGQNLMTFSKFDLWDPEIASNNGLSYPNQKSVTLGLQFNL